MVHIRLTVVWICSDNGPDLVQNGREHIQSPLAIFAKCSPKAITHWVLECVANTAEQFFPEHTTLLGLGQHHEKHKITTIVQPSLPWLCDLLSHSLGLQSCMRTHDLIHQVTAFVLNHLAVHIPLF